MKTKSPFLLILGVLIVIVVFSYTAQTDVTNVVGTSSTITTTTITTTTIITTTTMPVVKKIISISPEGVTCDDGLVTLRIQNAGVESTVTDNDIITAQINLEECAKSSLSLAPGQTGIIINAQACGASCGTDIPCSGYVKIRVGTINGIIESSTNCEQTTTTTTTVTTTIPAINTTALPTTCAYSIMSIDKDTVNIIGNTINVTVNYTSGIETLNITKLVVEDDTGTIYSNVTSIDLVPGSITNFTNYILSGIPATWSEVNVTGICQGRFAVAIGVKNQ